MIGHVRRERRRCEQLTVAPFIAQTQWVDNLLCSVGASRLELHCKQAAVGRRLQVLIACAVIGQLKLHSSDFLRVLAYMHAKRHFVEPSSTLDVSNLANI